MHICIYALDDWRGQRAPIRTVSKLQVNIFDKRKKPLLSASALVCLQVCLDGYLGLVGASWPWHCGNVATYKPEVVADEDEDEDDLIPFS
ncbi:hypothetical protein WAI453_004007 [Rhynchosporium graminicola]